MPLLLQGTCCCAMLSTRPTPALPSPLNKRPQGTRLLAPRPTRQPTHPGESTTLKKSSTKVREEGRMGCRKYDSQPSSEWASCTRTRASKGARRAAASAACTFLQHAARLGRLLACQPGVLRFRSPPSTCMHFPCMRRVLAGGQGASSPAQAEARQHRARRPSKGRRPAASAPFSST